MGYARTSDYVHGVTAAAGGPGLLFVMERMAPSQVGRGGFAQAMRLTGVLGAIGGFLYFYQRSCCTCKSIITHRASASYHPAGRRLGGRG